MISEPVQIPSPCLVVLIGPIASGAIERLRPKRTGAERFAREVNAGTVADHYERATRLLEAGATTLIVRLVDVADRGAVERLGELIRRVKA